jgi:hypothetical protein
MNKKFDVLQLDNCVPDYVYIIHNDFYVEHGSDIDSKYNYIVEHKSKNTFCSTGETELINFLYEFTDDNIQIMLINKPFMHFSPKIRTSIMKLLNKSNKQIIFTSYENDVTNNKTNVIQIELHDNKHCRVV